MIYVTIWLRIMNCVSCERSKRKLTRFAQSLIQPDELSSTVCVLDRPMLGRSPLVFNQAGRLYRGI
jgi:hypothetical protein